MMLLSGPHFYKCLNGRLYKGLSYEQLVGRFADGMHMRGADVEQARVMASRCCLIVLPTASVAAGNAWRKR